MLVEISNGAETRDRCIILDVASGVFMIDRHGEMYKANDLNVFRKELDSSDNYYVYDARKNGTPEFNIFAKTLIAASPDKTHYSPHRKEPTFKRLFMRLWDLEELQLCREHCYNEPGITEESVTRMYNLVGGVASHVFAEGQRDQENTIAWLRVAVNGMSFKRTTRIWTLRLSRWGATNHASCTVFATWQRWSQGSMVSAGPSSRAWMGSSSAGMAHSTCCRLLYSVYSLNVSIRLWVIRGYVQLLYTEDATCFSDDLTQEIGTRSLRRLCMGPYISR